MLAATGLTRKVGTLSPKRGEKRAEKRAEKRGRRRGEQHSLPKRAGGAAAAGVVEVVPIYIDDDDDSEGDDGDNDGDDDGDDYSDDDDGAPNPWNPSIEKISILRFKQAGTRNVDDGKDSMVGGHLAKGRNRREEEPPSFAVVVDAAPNQGEGIKLFKFKNAKFNATATAHSHSKPQAEGEPVAVNGAKGAEGGGQRGWL